MVYYKFADFVVFKVYMYSKEWKQQISRKHKQCLNEKLKTLVKYTKRLFSSCIVFSGNNANV